MIKTIYDFKENNFKTNLNKKNINSTITYNQHYSYDLIKKNDLRQISFNGNLSRLSKNILEETNSNLNKKITRFAEEAVESIKVVFNKFKKQDDLLCAKKPIIAASNSDDAIIDKSSKLLKDPNVPESNKNDIKNALKELRISQSNPENLTQNSSINLDIANLHAETAKKDFLKLLEDSKSKIIKAGHTVDPRDIDKKGELTSYGESKIRNPKNELHHHDFNDPSDNLNNHGQPSFKGEVNNLEHVNINSSSPFDIVANQHNLDTNLQDIAPINVRGVNTISDSHGMGANLVENITETTSMHESLTYVFDGVSNITEKLDNPLLHGILAEVLPGTKFLKPAKDLIDGNIDKAAVGTGTRLTEFAIAPVKLAWAGLGGLAGTISRLAGNKGKGTGFFGGVNEASKMWGRGRETVENFILDTKKEDSLKVIKKQTEAFEKETEKIINDLKQDTDAKINKIKETYKPRIENSKMVEKTVKQGVKKANEETIFYQNQSKVAKGQFNIINQAIDVRLQNLQEVQKQMEVSHKNLINELSQKLNDAKGQKNIKLQEEINLQLKEMQKSQKAEMEEITKNIKDLMQSSKVFEKINNKTNLKGFNRIAGYQEQINSLLDHVGVPIALEKIGKQSDVPGGILFFGPQGNGKTTFAEAFADRLGCNLVKITPEFDAKTNWRNLENIAENAQLRFQKDKTRTVILINEFDNFASNEPKSGFKKVIDMLSLTGIRDININLRKFIDECSKKYHCTVFATTNYPERIDVDLLSSANFYKTGLPPADKKNAAAVLKHYAEDFANNNIDYDKLAEYMVKNQTNEAFSNSRIRALVMDITKADKNKARKITQEDLYQSIINKGADIRKEDLELFNKQIEYMAKLSIKKNS